jgi:hypothetical protein
MRSAALMIEERVFVVSNGVAGQSESEVLPADPKRGTGAKVDTLDNVGSLALSVWHTAWSDAIGQAEQVVVAANASRKVKAEPGRLRRRFGRGCSRGNGV